MLVAIDWDNTYTRSPSTFGHIIKVLRAAGHEVMFVTGRSGTQPIDPTDYLGVMRIVYTNGEYKRKVCERLGYRVDVWIDDEPGTVEPGRLLEW